jgi:hypothetical protein
MDWTLTGITRAVRGVYGRAVNKATLPAYNQDDPAPLAFDLATGRLLVDATGGGGGADVQYTGSPAVTVGNQVETLSGGYDGTNVRPLNATTPVRSL